MRIYIVLLVDAYIPHVNLATIDKQEALDTAKALAKDWANEVLGDVEIYFNQAESGNMEDAVSVQAIELSNHRTESQRKPQQLPESIGTKGDIAV